LRDRRYFTASLLLAVAVVWAVLAWALMGTTLSDATGWIWFQRAVSSLAIVVLSLWILWISRQDRLPDHLAELVGPVYYEADGVCFMPTVRRREDGYAELCITYQNRHENLAHVIVHVRPPLDSFVIKAGTRDVHLAFPAPGGTCGVIRQPIVVPRRLQGEVVQVQMAAASNWPRGKGACLRRRGGMPCGALDVDWHGATFRTGVHEVSGEIEMPSTTSARLCMPSKVKHETTRTLQWRHEHIACPD